MLDLDAGFQSLPVEYQNVIRLAQDRHEIVVRPLETLAGGWSGAAVFLVSVSFQNEERIEHLVLKLDHKNEKSQSDEVRRHDAAVRLSPPGFATQHLAQMVFDRLEADGALGIFYSIAGQSLHQYRTLSAYDRQSQVEAIFALTYRYVLNEWNAARTFKQESHPSALLEKWLSFRLAPGGQIDKFLETVCTVAPEMPGFLLEGGVFPNPVAYARNPAWWGAIRSMDTAVGLQHGDLNTNNILVKFARSGEEVEGYYLIDFALFKEKMPLVFDVRYLEMSYLLLRQSQMPFARLADLIARLGEADSLDPQQVPTDVAGLCAIIGSTRHEYASWIEAYHPSLHDDLWGQFWLAGVAAGLAYCYKPGLGDDARMAGLVYAAANLKRFAALFGMPTPAEGRSVYRAAQFRSEKPRSGSPPAATGAWPSNLPALAPASTSTLPTGTVTFLFTDIEGSTEIAQEFPDAMPALLARHNALLYEAIKRNGGTVVRTTGDSFLAAFHTAPDAVRAAVDAQGALHREAWSPALIKVRMGISTGKATAAEPDPVTESYSGYSALARTQRVMSTAYGGQILVSNSSAGLLQAELPAGISLRDMGEHRLKGLSNLERLWQVVASDLPQEFPALATLSVIPNNLPVQSTAFIGREQELSSIEALLADGQYRLVTILAPGGMGKTRLAVEVANRMLPAFPQGVYFVALDRVSSADLIVGAVAEVLPISLASREDPLSRITDYLRDRAVLLVMDNYEHVLDGVAFVQEILRAAPRVRILATSRAKLNLTSETVFNIGGLATDASSPEKNSAVQLFAQRARRTQPDFELNDATLPAVTRICRMVDGMPLAIVLAAAWLDTLSVDEIAAEIANSLDILETELRDVPDRQRSVKVVIESSWKQVDAAAQNLLQRLSVYRGGFTRSAAQEAAGASLRQLSHLVDKALLRRDPITGRYSIHELLRQYAEEQLALAGELEGSAHEAHARYFADFMKTREMHLHDHRQKSALADIEADFDNIRVAWNYWTDKPDTARLNDFAEAIWIFFEVRGSFTPAIQFFGDAAKKLIGNEPAIVCARALLRARQAWFTALLGSPDEGLQMALESLDTLRQYDDQAITVAGFQGVTINAIFLNRDQLVFQITQDMVARAARSGDIWERGWALIWRSYALLIQRQIAEALQTGREALAIFEKTNNEFGLSVASGIVLGGISVAMGDFGTAKTHFMRGAKAAEEIGYLRMLQISYDNLGTVALLEGEVQQAEQFFLKSLRISEQCGQTREMLAALRDIASVHIAEGDLDEALQLVAVVLNHPVSDQNSLNRPERLRDETEKLRAKIEARLDQSRYQSAWQAGQRRDLGEVVAEILD